MEWIVAFFVLTPGSFLAIWLFGMLVVRRLGPRIDKWMDDWRGIK
jgi:hypothetical protein